VCHAHRKNYLLDKQDNAAAAPWQTAAAIALMGRDVQLTRTVQMSSAQAITDDSDRCLGCQLQLPCTPSSNAPDCPSP
jgi:hypothetical protein